MFVSIARQGFYGNLKLYYQVHIKGKITQQWLEVKHSVSVIALQEIE